MKIYLVTHAHTEQVKEEAADTWRLSSRGLAEARALANRDFWRDVDRVVVSSEPKTWLTVADLVTQRNMPVWIDSRFDELRRHGWVNDYAMRIAAVFENPTTSVEGWEAAANVQRRAMAALADLQQRFARKTLVVVSHGLCLSILRAAILGTQRVDFEAWQRLTFASHALISTTPLMILEDFVLSQQVER